MLRNLIFILIGAGILVVAVAAIAMSRTNRGVSAVAPSSTTGVEIDYTETGFSPATVTIKKGATVKFVNKSSGVMDVASNPHPVHTDYPGFDQGKSSFAGTNEYNFVFDKVGSWGFHNHANPSDTGTVVVQE